MRSNLRYSLAGLLVSLAVFGSVPARAAAAAFSSISYTATGGQLVPGAITGVTNASQWAANGSAGAVTFTENVGARVAANDVAMVAKRTIPYLGILAGAARMLPYVAAATTIYSIYDLMRCHADGVTGVLCDGGVPKTQQTHTCYRMSQSFGRGVSLPPNCIGDAAAALQAEADSVGMVITGLSCSGATCTFTQVGGGYVHAPTTTTGRADVVSALMCAQGQPGADGLCPGGAQNHLSYDDAAAVVQPYTPPSNAPVLAHDVAAGGTVDLAPYALPAPVPLTGPAQVVGPAPSTVVTPAPTADNPHPAPVTQPGVAPVYNIQYQGDHYTYMTTTTVNNPDGSTTATTNPTPEITCGLPGTPVCQVKVDETGTRDFSPNFDRTPNTLPTTDSQKMNDTAAGVQAPSFGFISAPPIAECTPFDFAGKGSLNPCGIVGDVRGVMAYLWALAAAWMAFGWIRQTIAA